MRKVTKALATISATGFSTSAFAAAGVPEVINYYAIVGHAIGLDDHAVHKWMPTMSALLVLGVITLVGLAFKANIAKDGDNVVPNGKFGMRFLLETIIDIAYTICKDNCGKNYRRFMPLLGGLFVYILFINLSGLIPGFPPATESMANNVAMGVVTFIVYNFAGLKEHGFASYMKHFAGPVIWIAPLFFCIELVSHASRPLSLGLRLTGNIFGDHLLLGVFTGMVYLVFPAALLFFGTLVSVIQSFVFTLLTGLYISLAISHDH